MSGKIVFFSCLFLFVFSGFSQGMPPTDPSSGKLSGMPPEGPPRSMHGSLDNPQPMMMNIAELQNLMSEINIDKATSKRIISIARGFIAFFEAKILKIQKEELAVKEELLKEKPDMQAIHASIAPKIANIF